MNITVMLTAFANKKSTYPTSIDVKIFVAFIYIRN